jgi:hypothetical protein
MPEQHDTRPEHQGDDAFVPKGAVAFMILMIAAYGVIWFLFYFLMVGRP